MTISLRLNEEDAMLIKKYAEIHHLSVSDLIRQAVLEKIEDEYDRKSFDKAMVEYNEHPITYSLDEVEKELHLR